MLAHLLRVGLEAYIEGDISRPEFVRLASPNLKIQGDNPDALYFLALIDSSKSYLLQGETQGEVHLNYSICFCIYT
jgi:hypothetical protein